MGHHAAAEQTDLRTLQPGERVPEAVYKGFAWVFDWQRGQTITHFLEFAAALIEIGKWDVHASNVDGNFPTGNSGNC